MEMQHTRSGRLGDAICWSIMLASALYLTFHLTVLASRNATASQTEQPAIPDRHAALLEEIIRLESNGRHNAVGAAGELGPLQFMEKTFYWYAKRYGLTWMVWENPDHQILLADRMLRDGFCFEWTTCDRARLAVITKEQAVMAERYK